MLRKINVFILVLIAISTSIAQIKILDEPTRVYEFQFSQPDLLQKSSGFSGTLFEVLDQTFDSLTALSQIKGFNAALLGPDGTLWKRATGISQELPTPVSLKTQDLMGIGSITKSYVSATMLLLLEDGLLSLDDSIGMYLTSYPNVPGEATIRQLLSHRTGINDYIRENSAALNAVLANPDSIWIADSILHNLVLVPNFELGAAWSYSNTNYLLAGRIIENITGQPWYEVVRDRIIDPMGLTHTFIYPYESPDSQLLSHCWFDIDSNGVVDDLQGNGITIDGLFSLAGSVGCIISNPEDLAYFSEQLYGGFLLLPSTLAEMQTDYMYSPQGWKYGLGTINIQPVFGVDNWGHDGSLVYQSIAYYFPEEKMSLTIQQNDDRVGPGHLDIFDIYSALLNIYLDYTANSAVNDIENIEGLRVFPNPANDYLTIEFDDNISQDGNLNIYNSIGQILHSETIQKGEYSKSINLSNFSEGTYFLYFEIGEKKEFQTSILVH